MTAGGVCSAVRDTWGDGSAARTPSATAGTVVARAAPAAIRAAREPGRATSLRALGSPLWRCCGPALVSLLFLSGGRPEMPPWARGRGHASDTTHESSTLPGRCLNPGGWGTGVADPPDLRRVDPPPVVSVVSSVRRRE